MAQHPNLFSQTVITEVLQIKALLEETAASLKSQREILKARGMSLPPMVMQAVSAISHDMDTLEAVLVDDQVELGQLRFLAQTSAMINSTFNVDDVLIKAMDVIIDLTNAERGYIILKDNESGEFEFVVVRENELSPKQAASAPQISQTVLHEVLLTGQALLTDNAYQDDRLAGGMSIAQMVLRSVLCVPLNYKDEIIGVVYVDNRLRAGVFTEREKNLLTAFANQMAVTIENAHLYAGIQETLRKISAMKEVMDNVFASIGSGVVTTDARHAVTLFNRAAAIILDQDPQKVLGKRIRSVLPSISADLDGHLMKVRQDNMPQSLEAEIQMARRRVALSIKLSPLTNAQNEPQGVAMVMDDLTEKKMSEETLSLIRRYLPPEMVENIHTISRLALGGEKREVTCMFVDVRPVHTFDTDRPQDIMEQLNEYITRATGSIHRHKGMIDKYMGTIVMALFNTQLNPMEDHAYRALKAALGIREAFVAFYKELGIDPNPHYYCIGIHSGEATLGNVGSLTRREFSAIGDTINLSKRLQENTKAGQIIISENTYQHILNNGGFPDHVRFEAREPIKAKGRQQQTPVYEVLNA